MSENNLISEEFSRNEQTTQPPSLYAEFLLWQSSEKYQDAFGKFGIKAGILFFPTKMGWVPEKYALLHIISVVGIITTMITRELFFGYEHHIPSLVRLILLCFSVLPLILFEILVWNKSRLAFASGLTLFCIVLVSVFLIP